ncbi:hypothetical protein [Streptomyces nojiriensis]
MISLLCISLVAVAMAVLVTVGFVANHRDAQRNEPRKRICP